MYRIVGQTIAGTYISLSHLGGNITFVTHVMSVGVCVCVCVALLASSDVKSRKVLKSRELQFIQNETCIARRPTHTNMEVKEETRMNGMMKERETKRLRGSEGRNELLSTECL